MSEEMSNYVADNKLKRPSGQHHSLRLQDQVRNPKLWPTPNVKMSGRKLTNGRSISGKGVRWGKSLSQSVQETATGSLNPTWVEWLMGFPTGWTDLED